MNSESEASAEGRSASVSDIGRVRSENQDAVLADDKLGLWLVADGMGGHAGGARASAIARDTVRQRVDEGVRLADSIMAAHRAIRDEQDEQPRLNDMGTTIVALAESGEEFEVCWVGDSRAYRYSPQTSEFSLLTRDHNVAGVLVASGALSPDEATRHPQRHVLTDCLGLSGEAEPRIDRITGRWQPGDRILLCSDGLSGELGDTELARIMRSGAPTGDLVDRFLQRALEAGAHDNISAVVVAAPDKAARASRWRWPFGARSG